MLACLLAIINRITSPAFVVFTRLIEEAETTFLIRGPKARPFFTNYIHLHNIHVFTECHITKFLVHLLQISRPRARVRALKKRINSKVEPQHNYLPLAMSGTDNIFY